MMGEEDVASNDRDAGDGEEVDDGTGSDVQ